MNALAPLMSSADQTWNTPDWFAARVVRALGPIMFDPCSNAYSILNAAVEVRHDRGENGLTITWRKRGLMVLNAPFDLAEEFMAKLHEADEAVTLMPSRTDTGWWHAAADTSCAIILWRGRFSFRRPATKRGNAPFPSTVFYRGPRRDAFLTEFQHDGLLLERGRSRAFVARRAV